MSEIEQNKELLPVDSWQVDTLRLTSFIDPSIKVGEPNWWQDLFNDLPETKLSHPKLEGHQQIGPFEAGNMVLAVLPGRIDWLFTTVPGRRLTPDSILTVGSFPSALAKFRPRMLDWLQLETCPSSKRLAFGAVLLHIVDKPRTGNKQLLKYLPQVQVDPDSVLDFAYQINRPRKIKLEATDLSINRLSKWGVVQVLPKQISLSALSEAADQTEALERVACRLELDISTIQNFAGELSREQLPAIFNELVTFGKEIVQWGDIP